MILSLLKAINFYVSIVENKNLENILLTDSLVKFLIFSAQYFINNITIFHIYPNCGNFYFIACYLNIKREI